MSSSAGTSSALVTGASRGIGRGIAQELAARGYGLTITARDGDCLERLAADLRTAGAPSVVPVPADLADRAACGRVVDAHRERFGSADVLVLAGGVGTAAPIGELAAHRLDKTFAVNLMSAIALTQAMLPMLRAGAARRHESGGGGSRVIALSSITGVYAEAGLAAYGASKAALGSFMETLNAEESGNGVMATAIAPGYVATDMSAWTSDSISPSAMLQVSDVVTVVGMLLELGPNASIPQIVMSRSGAGAYRA